MPLTEAAAEHQEVKRRVCAEFDVEQRHAATALLEQRGYSWLAATWEEKLAACLAASAARTALVERMKKAARKATWTLPATEPIRRDSWNRPVCADPAAQAPVAYELHRLAILTAISEQPAAPSPYLSVISRKAFGASPKQVSEEHKLSRSLLVRNQSASHLAMFFGEEPASNPARAGCVQCGRYRCNGEDTCRRKPKLPPLTLYGRVMITAVTGTVDTVDTVGMIVTGTENQRATTAMVFIPHKSAHTGSTMPLGSTWILSSGRPQ